MKRFIVQLLLSCCVAFISLLGCVEPQYECLFDDGIDCTPVSEGAQTIDNPIESWTCQEELSHQKYNGQRSWLQTDEGYVYQQLLTCTCVNEMKYCDPISGAKIQTACDNVIILATVTTTYSISQPYMTSSLINACPSLITATGPCLFWHQACNHIKM